MFVAAELACHNVRNGGSGTGEEYKRDPCLGGSQAEPSRCEKADNRGNRYFNHRAGEGIYTLADDSTLHQRSAYAEKRQRQRYLAYGGAGAYDDGR